MNITKAQYARIEKYFPVQRGNVKIDNYTFINAILYIAENGCKWRALPEKYGKWNSIYQRFKRWCENGVIQRIFNALQQEKIIAIKVEVLALDSTSCKLHPDAHGALKNTDNNVSGNQRADGIPSFTWYPQMTRSLSKCTYPVETVTTPHQGRISIENIGDSYWGIPYLMDRAYEGDQTSRAFCQSFRHKPVVPPEKNRINPWEYDHELYKRRNIIRKTVSMAKSVSQSVYKDTHKNSMLSSCRSFKSRASSCG